MNLGVLQIGDIHTESRHDLALRYLVAVPSVLNDPALPAFDLILVLLCGDLAYSGKTSEYECLTDPLETLKSELERIAKCPVYILAIPGNHDCNFEKNTEIRNLVISSIPKGDIRLSDKSIVKNCLVVQEEFWKFAQSKYFAVAERNDDNIYLEFLFKVDLEEVKVRLYNTAWTSQIHEKAGTMGLPRSYFADHDKHSKPTFTIAALHHPTHWFTPNRKREFDVILDHSADIVIFGHEHLPEEYLKSDFDGEQIGYIFGGVFQSTPHDCPGQFNLIVVDTIQGKQKTIRYQRSGNHFDKNDRNPQWLHYGARSPELISGFRLSKRQMSYLEDAEIEFVHRSGKSLSLDDIFITPDFSIINDDHSLSDRGQPKILRGDNLDNYLGLNKKLLILGRERSGRTSLCKRLFWSLYRGGIVPVMIHGSKINTSVARNAAPLLQSALFEAYENPTLPEFNQTDAKFRALIIDGFETAKLTAKGRVAFLREMERKFEVIIAVGDPLMMIEEITAGVTTQNALPGFARLEIRELGRAARRRLVRRWYSIGLDSFGGIPVDEIHKAEKIVDTLLGKSFLPSYPVFILSFLQSIESSRPVDNIGSYGYHYEAFITNALSRFATQINLDIKYQFLSELAFKIFKARSESREIEETEIFIFWGHYCTKYGISPDRTTLLDGFISARILEKFEGAYRFRYGYAFYFFVARYFRDHIEDKDVCEEIVALSKSFHIEQNANIWLFLAHLSKSRFLLSTLVERAKGMFLENEPLRLDNDIGFLRDIGMQSVHEDDLKFVLPGTTTEENLESHYDSLDELDQSENKNWKDDLSNPEASTLFARIDAMVRTIQVLGQVLKNFPGSMTASEKHEVVNEAFRLGLRGLAFIMREVEAEKDELMAYITERLAVKYDLDARDKRLRQRVSGGIFWLMRLNIFGMLKIISQGVGSKGEEVTYSAVVNEIDSFAAKLIDVSISLDTLHIPKRKILDLHKEFGNDFLTQNLLVSLVAHHFYLFSAPTGIRDELCSKLGIEVKQLIQTEAAASDYTKRV